MNTKFKIMVFANWTRFLLAAISIATMVLMPVADGLAAQKQAQEWNENFVKNTIVELGLNKPQTLGQFYDKNKSKFPKGILDLVDATVAGNRDQKLPQFEVTSVKGTNGERIPVLRVTKDGALFNVELHNNERFFAKVGNVELTQGNIQNFTDIFVKLYNADPKFKKLGEGQASASSVSSPIVSENKISFPEMTKELWKSMTPHERVAYITNLRLLWGNARDVLQLDPNSSLNGRGIQKNKKTSSINSFESILEFLIGTEAGAQAPKVQAKADKGIKLDSAPPRDAQGIPELTTNQACLVAGYVTNYKGTTCTIKAIKDRYSKNDTTGSKRVRTQGEIDFFSKSWDHCERKGQIACNPMIYGVHADGNAICIPTTTNKKDISKDFQKATHFKGPCETGTLLKGVGTDFLNEDLRDGDRYKTDNRKKSDDELRKEQLDLETAAGFKNTEAFLAALLKGKNPELHALFIEGKMTDQLREQLVTIQEAFAGQINEAKDACTSSVGRKGHEENFYGACDQMHRRQLFLVQFLQSNENFKCKGKNEEMDQETLKCVPAGTGGSSGGSSSACPEPFVPAGGSLTHCECKSKGSSSSLEFLKKKSKAEIAILCPDSEDGNSVKCASNMEPIKFQGADACKCKNGTQTWELPALAEELKKKTPIEKLCQQSGSGAAGAGEGDRKPDPNAGKCDPTSVKPTCAGGKPVECRNLVGEDSDQWAWKCPVGTAEENKPGWGSKILGWLEKAAPWLVVGFGIWWLNKKGPKPPPITPPGDNCGAGGIPCTTPCQNVNHVRSPVSPYVCGCREPGPGMVIVDHTTCEPVKATDTPQQITCGDGSKVTPPAECPTKDCAGGIKVPVGVECPVETPSTKPTSSPTGVQK